MTTLIWRRDGGDHYEGESAAIYRDDALIWHGYSCDQAENIARALDPELDVWEVRAWPGGRYELEPPACLADVLPDAQRPPT